VALAIDGDKVMTTGGQCDPSKMTKALRSLIEPDTVTDAIYLLHCLRHAFDADPTEPGKPPSFEVDPSKAPPENPDRDLHGTPGFSADDPGRARLVDDSPPGQSGGGVPPPPCGKPEIRK